MKLKRELNFFSLVLYGIGVIVGAGIYSLIGVAAGPAQGMLWLAFLLSAILAFFTALSYAELSSIVSKEAAEYHYAKKAFGRELPAFIVGWTHAAANVFFASTVAIAFAGYFSAFTGLDYHIVAAALLLIMGVLNFLGMKLSSLYNDFCAIISVLGLLIIAILGIMSPPSAAASSPLTPPSSGLIGLVSAVALVFFAYIGFENIANVAEEVEDSQNSVPRAILFSLAISAVLYIMVSLASVRIVGWQALSQSSSPLALVASKGIWNLSPIIIIIALFATSNTVLIALISASRILYGISNSGSLPSIFSGIGKRGTPWFSVLLTAATAIFIGYFTDIKTAAELTNIGVFLAYFAVNVCLITISHTANSKKGKFHSPRIFGAPIFAWLGAISSLFMLAYIGLGLWLPFLGIIFTGVLVYALFKLSKHHQYKVPIS